MCGSAHLYSQQKHVELCEFKTSLGLHDEFQTEHRLHSEIVKKIKAIRMLIPRPELGEK